MPPNNNNQALPDFIRAMLLPEFYPHPVMQCELIETHISWVILTGQFVYKIKKPVNFGFLDFSTLDKRKFYCDEELRLNQRLAKDIYLSVCKLTGLTTVPQLNGEGEVFEYAVKMIQFDQTMQLDHIAARGELTSTMIDDFANLIGYFHHRLDADRQLPGYGDLQHVYAPVEENFQQMIDRVTEKAWLEVLQQLKQWSRETFSCLDDVFVQRKQSGSIRECHGDLHLRNMAWVNGKPLAFDCLEFNANFRWTDVMSEVAFLVMDLRDHQHAQFAQRFLNRYLEVTGDYTGMRVLPFYLVYRAMVRAKVNAIRLQQAGIALQEKRQVKEELNSYLKLALYYTRPMQPYLIITRGMSASGKSTLTQPLLEAFPAIRMRSDVERKRLFELDKFTNAQSEPGKGIYTSDATERTYQKLAELAGVVLTAGVSVIVDATFARYEQRELFKQLAIKSNLPFVILELTAAPNTLRQRIRQRRNDVSDADITVLESQLKSWQKLEPDEYSYTVSVDTESDIDTASIITYIKQVVSKV